MALPTEKTVPNTDVTKLKLLIYGESKIGKSTFCSYFEDALFISTEPTISHLSVYAIQVKDWKEFSKACLEVSEGNHHFKTIIIDTVDKAFEMCRNYIFNTYKIKHESELGYGKGWKLLSTEFMRVMSKIINLDYGIIIVGHSKKETINKQSKEHSYDVFKIDLPTNISTSIVVLLDAILYANLYNRERVFKTINDKYCEAGNRINLPAIIPMDYQKFMNVVKTGLIANINKLTMHLPPEEKTITNNYNILDKEKENKNKEKIESLTNKIGDKLNKGVTV